MTDISLFTTTPPHSVYQLTWAETQPELVERVPAAGGSFISAATEEDRWTVELRFSDQAAASRFYSQYTDAENPITIQKTRSSEPSAWTLGEVLTAEQRAAIVCAIDGGYFEVPRRTTLVELSTGLGISDSAFSQRLRRGLNNILEDGAFPPTTTSTSEVDESR